jgi:hypothetical protein
MHARHRYKMDDGSAACHGQLTVGDNKRMRETLRDVNKINRRKQINPSHDDVQIIRHSLLLLYFLVLNREKVMYS